MMVCCQTPTIQWAASTRRACDTHRVTTHSPWRVLHNTHHHHAVWITAVALLAQPVDTASASLDVGTTHVLLHPPSTVSPSPSLQSAPKQNPLVSRANISWSCDPHQWGPMAPTYCVATRAAEYLPLPGQHFGYNVNWTRFPDARLWQKGDGITFTDDIPICYHDPTASRALNTTSFIAAIKHYKLATTYCSWPDYDDFDFVNDIQGNLGNDPSTCDVAEWGYDWFAAPSQPTDRSNSCDATTARHACNATDRAGVYECVRSFWQCRVMVQARTRSTNAPVAAMLGHFWWHHYSAQWTPLGIVGSEVGENIAGTQSHIAFNRGAARQYHIPWFIDFSDWYAGTLRSYKFNTTSGTFDRANDGHSISLRNRVAYVTYMAGASKHKMEDSPLFYDDNTTGSDGYLKLSPVGQAAQQTHNFFVSNPDRGTPYVPIGIIINTFHGMGLAFYNIHFINGSRSQFVPLPGQPNGPFGMAPTLPYSEGDNVSVLLFNTLWPSSIVTSMDPNTHDESERMVPSKYPEVFDVLVDDIATTLGPPDYSWNLYDNYRVLFLTGDIDFEATASVLPSFPGQLAVDDALHGWTSRGGTLVLHAQVVSHNNFSNWGLCTTALGTREVVHVTGTVDSVGNPVSHAVGTVTTIPTILVPNRSTVLLNLNLTNGTTAPAVVSCAVGDGQVVVMLPPIASDLDTFGILDWVLDALMDSVHPFEVSGGKIDLLLNRRLQGWNITLVNNLGVTKSCSVNAHCEPDKIDPTQLQSLTVTLRPEYAAILGNLSSTALDTTQGVVIDVTNNAFHIEVPAGEVRVVGVDHVRGAS
eukprot:m.203072 g.203072  ORF g.203072 m.203072 type:complete len:811 (+) comp22013_c0_seq1:85-2517(+)